MLCPCLSKPRFPPIPLFVPNAASSLPPPAPTASPAAPAVQTAADRLRRFIATGAVHAEPEHDLWRGELLGQGDVRQLAPGRYLDARRHRRWLFSLPNPAAWIGGGCCDPAASGLAYSRAAVVAAARHRIYADNTTIPSSSAAFSVEWRIRFCLSISTMCRSSKDLMGRLLNFGTITLLSNDVFRCASWKLCRPSMTLQRVANLIDDARREERRKRAIYMANA